MANKKISDLPVAVSANDSDMLEANQAGTSRSVTRTQLLAAEVTARAAADTTLTNSVNTLTSTKAALAGPTFTGVPAAPTAALGTNTTQISTTAFVQAALAGRIKDDGTVAMAADLSMASNQITNLGTPSAGTDAANKTYVDGQRDTCIRKLQDYDPTATGAYPTTYDSAAIEAGAAYYITVAGNIGPATVVPVSIGDVIIARVDAAGNVHASWSIINKNVETASTTVVGIVELATDVETLALSSTTVVVTPSNLAALDASTTQVGLVELATDAELLTGTDTVRPIVPSSLAAGYSAWRVFLGIADVINIASGTWAVTRIAQGDYVYRKVAANNTSVIGIDITEAYRTAASRGFRLDNFSVIHRNITADLDAHSVTLDEIDYSHSSPVTVTSVTLNGAGALPVGQDADPQVTTCEVTTPAYFNGNKYVMEITVDAAAGSVYDFIGVQLAFTRTIF